MSELPKVVPEGGGLYSLYWDDNGQSAIDMKKQVAYTRWQNGDLVQVDFNGEHGIICRKVVGEYLAKTRHHS